MSPRTLLSLKYVLNEDTLRSKSRGLNYYCFRRKSLSKCHSCVGRNLEQLKTDSQWSWEEDKENDFSRRSFTNYFKFHPRVWR